MEKATRAQPSSVRLKSAGQSHKGLVWRRNEDSILISHDMGLFVLADGINSSNHPARWANG